MRKVSVLLYSFVMVTPAAAQEEIPQRLRELFASTGADRVQSLQEIKQETEECSEPVDVWDPNADTGEIGRGFSRYGGSGEFTSTGRSSSAARGSRASTPRGPAVASSGSGSSFRRS